MQAHVVVTLSFLDLDGWTPLKGSWSGALNDAIVYGTRDDMHNTIYTVRRSVVK